MKILSGGGFGFDDLVTNAEVLAFLAAKRKSRRRQLPDGGKLDIGPSGAVAHRALIYLQYAPLAAQTVDAVARLRVALQEFGLSDVEFVQVCNLRADNDNLLERSLLPATASRLTDDDWYDMKSRIHAILEPRQPEVEHKSSATD
jgi:hypothetical protein